MWWMFRAFRVILCSRNAGYQQTRTHDPSWGLCHRTLSNVGTGYGCRSFDYLIYLTSRSNLRLFDIRTPTASILSTAACAVMSASKRKSLAFSELRWSHGISYNFRTEIPALTGRQASRMWTHQRSECRHSRDSYCHYLVEILGGARRMQPYICTSLLQACIR